MMHGNTKPLFHILKNFNVARCPWLTLKNQNLYNMHPKILVEF